MILSAASSLYGAIARQRRQWYAHDTARQRRLHNPVISVGNLRVGGTGKTPTVAYLARLVIAAGERPSILSRGYARRRAADGVTVVSDGHRVLADVDQAGDEPLMLARMLPGVPVLVGSDRYLAGRLGEERLGVTVHLLDDGFQHVALFRDIDLLLADEADLSDRVLPAGRLREALSAAQVADAVLTGETGEEHIETLRTALRVPTIFQVRRELGSVRLIRSGEVIRPKPDVPILAVAGIARPQRFFDDLAAAGWHLAGTLSFRDHHRYVAADVAAIVRAAREAAAETIITTEKDAVRFEVILPTFPTAPTEGAVRLAVAPMTVTIESDSFTAWLTGRLAASRAQRPGRSHLHTGNPDR